MPIKLVKLATSELIIGDIISGSEDLIKIKHPLLLLIDRQANNGEYYLGEYIPMCNDDNITLSYKDIITIINPIDKLLNTWTKIIDGKHTNSLNSNIQFH